jgi:hypothetical protein
MSHVDDGMLHAYLDGELAPAEAQGVDAHLAQCPDCRRRLDEERALIARADELLAMAAPPERAGPPLRAGDVRPPARLWWQVRLPLAWAATVLLALGIGTYFGSRSAAYRSQVATDRAEPFLAGDSVAPAPRRALAQRAVRRAPAPAPAASPAPALIAQRAAEPGASNAAPAGNAVPLLAPAARFGEFSFDSARVALGREPVVLPGAPIRALRRAQLPQYTAAVVIEQQLDAGTVIQLVEGRRAEMRMDAVAAERRQARPAAQAAAPIRPVRLVDELEVTISGPLSLDSLTRLLQRVAPPKP